MNKEVSLKAIIEGIASTFKKYNLTIFIIVLAGGLGTAVILLNNTLKKSSDTSGYSSNLDITSFDQATIDRIKQLHTSSEFTGDVALPTGRINPFAE